jgi:serine/threonine protein phosphatase PrpC
VIFRPGFKGRPGLKALICCPIAASCGTSVVDFWPHCLLQTFTLKALPGDIVVMGTDGLFDNVFDFELLNIVNMSRR